MIDKVIEQSNMYPTRCNVTHLFYLETALNVSGCTTTHLQERKQKILKLLVKVSLPAAIATGSS